MDLESRSIFYQNGIDETAFHFDSIDGISSVIMFCPFLSSALSGN